MDERLHNIHEHLLERHPNRALELLKYADTIRDFSQTTSGTAWLRYDQDFRRKQERNPTNSWSSLDMELYARMLRHGTVAMHTQRQQFFRPSREQQTKPCYGFNKGTCTNHANECAYVHKCLTCDKIGHPSTRCFQRQSQGFKPQPKSKACFNCGQEGHLAVACSKPRAINASRQPPLAPNLD